MANLETKWSIKFYLETRKQKNEEESKIHKIPIYMFVTFGHGKRLQFYTRELVFANQFDPEYFNKVKADRNYFRPIKPQANQARSINGRLEKIAQETLRLIEFAKNSVPPIEITYKYLKAGLKSWIDKDVSQEDIKEITLAEAMDEYKKYSELHHAQKTVSGFKQIRDNIESFTQQNNWQNPILSKIDQSFIDGFETYLIKKRVNNKPLSNNTYAKNLKKLKTFFRWCKEKGWFNGNLIIKYKENEGAIIFLTKEELVILENATLSTKLLDRIRDIFIFGIFTGLRYGDLRSLKKNDVREGRIWFYEQKNKATIERSIKLMPKAIEIVEKYKDLPGDKLLPAYTNPNEKLKDVFAEAKIERQVTILKKFAGGKTEETILPLSKLAHSHMERKTFITLGLTMGIPEVVLKSITGHSKNSKAFNRYYNIIDSVKDEAMDATFGKL